MLFRLRLRPHAFQPLYWELQSLAKRSARTLKWPQLVKKLAKITTNQPNFPHRLCGSYALPTYSSTEVRSSSID